MKSIPVNQRQNFHFWIIFLTFLVTDCIGLSCKQHWAYVEVRPKAHMFYWLYESPMGCDDVPLVMWLQGGPGGSSTGFGNFEEIGPLDVDQNPRNTTWLSAASLLFVDNPVGTGFSYVDDYAALTTDVDMIASDMLTLLKSFFMESEGGKKFQKVPFFIFSESYGGKMTAAISEVLYKAVQTGKINCNFKGLALGDSWISPIDSMLNWGPYLYTNSLVDRQGLSEINASAQQASDFVNSNLWKNATTQFGKTQNVIIANTNGVNFYNILQWSKQADLLSSWNSVYGIHYNGSLGQRLLATLHEDKLAALMNGPIRKKLGIIPKNVFWGSQSSLVFSHMTEDFMKPVIDTVNRLIEKTSLDVVVYTGQLDLIVCTPGTEKWIESLNIFNEYKSVKRQFIKDPVTKLMSGYVKTLRNFSVYWILSAGHMIPKDNGSTALEMLKHIIQRPN